MAPPAKGVRKASKPPENFRLSTSPFIQDSVKDKVKRWNLADPETIKEEEKKARSAASKQSSSRSDDNSKSSSSEATKDSKKESSVQSGEDKETSTQESSAPSDDQSKKRPRSKTTGDSRVVDWPSTPDRPSSSEREPQTAPPRHILVTPKTTKHNALDPDVKRASAPPRRVISDGRWVRYRNLPKEPSPPKPPPEPKPKVIKLANGPAGLAWARPSALPRRLSNTEPKPKPIVIEPELPKVRKYTGKKMMKPIWHQFDVEKERARLEARDAAKNEVYDFRKSRKWNLPTLKRQDDPKSSVEESDEDEDDDSLSETSGRRSPDVHRNISIQRSPPQLSYKKRRPEPDKDNETEPSRHSYREPERIPLSSMGRRHSSIQKSPPRVDDDGTSMPSRYHHRGKSTGNLVTETRERPGALKYEEQRKPSYNAGDVVPLDEDGNAHVPIMGLPARLASWLTTTPDPFVASPDKSAEKSGKPSFARRLFSFDRDKPESRSSNQTGKESDEASESTTPSQTPQSRRKEQENLRSKERSSHKLDGVDSEISVDYASSITSTPTLKRSAGPKYKSPARGTAESRVTEGSDVSTSIATYSEVTNTTESSSSDVFFDDHLKPAPLSPRRGFPSTGKRLSTIMSVDSLHSRAQPDAPSIISQISEATEKPERTTKREVSISEPKKKEKATKSSPAALVIPEERASSMSRAKSVVSVRSTRSFRSRIADSNITEVMKDLAADEEDFMPELRTLVGGVIKVLFRAVLSKSDAAVAAGLFSKFATEQGGEKDARRSIHEMGVALERLKSYHIRTPTDDPNAFLIWARGAHKIYAEYVRTWRLGFQDVVVELVPEEDASQVSGRSGRDIDGNSMVDALPLNDKGYVTNQQGEIVDVAFLLKRPLVRLKFLAKTIKAVDILQPTEESTALTKKYDELMESARRKVNTERARIEDQRAAMIDSRRARDPKNMGALSGVKIDPNRCVRARDFFDMHFIHSTGQEVLVRIEILIRDDAPKLGTQGGDILLCQVDDHGRWLFLPPIMLKNVSARKGVDSDELILMIRGMHSGGVEWRELMSLKSGEDDVAVEWLQMLGNSPIPPAFSRTSIVKDTLHVPSRRPTSSRGSSLLSGSAFTESTDREYSRPPSPTATDILPIGERAGPDANRWGSATPERSGTVSPITPITSDTAPQKLRKVSPSELYKKLGSGNHGLQRDRRSPTTRRTDYFDQASPEPEDKNDVANSSGQGVYGLRRTKATKLRSSPISPTNEEGRHTRKASTGGSRRDTTSASPVESRERSNSAVQPRSKGYSVWMPSESGLDDDKEDDDYETHLSITSSQAPSLHRRSSSMPVKADRESRRHNHDRYSSVSVPSTEDSSSDLAVDQPYDSLPTTPYQQKRQSRTKEDGPPPPPPHKTPMSKQSPPDKLTIPQLTPSALSLKRRSSSPLKHEYQPSTSSERSLSEEELSDDYDDDFLASSESETEEQFEEPVKPGNRQYQPPEADVKADTLTPSQSASQGPFRDVPESQTVYLTTIAGVSRWHNGEYVNLHPKECLIEVTPGRIAAFEAVPELTYPNIAKKPNTDPIVSLHLTPGILVQVTNVCDIMVRSKPCNDSQFVLKHGGGVHIRFHTRHPSVREGLQDAVGRAMATNPTFLALERARPRPTQAEIFDEQNPGSAPRQTSRSWWGGSRKTGSFRKANTRSGSTVGNTENTYRTTSSLKRSINHILGKATGFNIEKSAIFSKTRGKSSGENSRSIDGDAPASPPPPADAFALESPNDLQHTVRTAQCRVISMEKNQRSRTAKNKGRATLRILHAPRKPTGSVFGITGPDGIHEGTGVRVVLANREGVMLDQVLPPSCFNKTPKGITIHIFSEGADGGVRDKGGVGTWAVQEMFLDGVSYILLSWWRMNANMMMIV